MTDAGSILQAALAGRPIERPLLAPLFAALAAEVEELPLEKASIVPKVARRGIFGRRRG
jgi:hypothetical protein